MLLTLSKNLLGTPSHLVVKSEASDLGWSNKIPTGSWVYGDTSHISDISDSLCAAGVSIAQILDDSQNKSWSLLRPSGTSGLPLHLVLGKDQLKYRLSYLLDQLWCFLKDPNNSYYVNEFLSHRSFLGTLERAKIDIHTYENLIDTTTVSESKKIQSFRPDNTGYCSLPKYNQSGSSTGRLTVTGPNILTLKKENRSILKSRFMNGKLLQIDLTSLEPRIALAIMEKDSPIDIYAHIRDHVFFGEISREVCKIATICTIYGGSARSLLRQIPDLKSSQMNIEKIKKFFGIYELQRSHDAQIKTLGWFTNFYGRRLNPTGANVNHFIQSTGVDIALLYFSSIVERCRKRKLKMSPLFVIHDALVIDVDLEDLDEIVKIVKMGFNPPKMNHIFPAKIKDLCD